LSRQVITKGKLQAYDPATGEGKVGVEHVHHYQSDGHGWCSLALVDDDAQGLGVVMADSKGVDLPLSMIDVAALQTPRDENGDPTGEPHVPCGYLGLTFADETIADPETLP